MKDKELKSKNGTSVQKEKISLKKEWNTAEDRVNRFISWIKGGK